jgi:arylsulfatase A-like enzyme
MTHRPSTLMRGWRFPLLGIAAVGVIVVLVTGTWLAAPGGEPESADEGPAVLLQAERPNILWITSEDNGPHYGAYGDAYATTPNLDALAARGFRYRTAWSNGPVCGAARSALITGVHPPANGGEHMRSTVRLPDFMRLYPALLRDAGYYVTNNSKTDYNFPEVEPVWDESSGQAHWRNRSPDQPFFAIFNITVSHESQVRTRPHTWTHDVDQAPVPPYMPDVRETREDWAQYYDQLTAMDAIVGERLAELDAAGLADDTIVMHYGDHGAGLPRSKRFPYDSGLRVPMIVYIPPKYQALGPPEASEPGRESLRLVSFVDLAPTLLSLAGVEPPEWMQGRAFLGPHATPDPEYLYGFRGRMDERYDMVRSVRDQRYVYLRNYMPHRPYGQYVEYMFQTPTTQVWKRLYDEGALRPPQTLFWEPKPSEELYDLENDPWEVNNLAGSASHQEVLARMREALDAHTRGIRDVGFLPEYELHRDEQVRSTWERAQDPAAYDFDRVYEMAGLASHRLVPLARIRPGLTDPDAMVRYWAATGVLIRDRDGVAAAALDLERLLEDPEPGPRIVAAEALARFGSATQRDRAIAVLLDLADASRQREYVATFALYSLTQVPNLPRPVIDAVRLLPDEPTVFPGDLAQRQPVLVKLVAAALAGNH